MSQAWHVLAGVSDWQRGSNMSGMDIMLRLILAGADVLCAPAGLCLCGWGWGHCIWGWGWR